VQKVNIYTEYNKSAVGSITAANSYVAPIKLFGKFNFSLSGTWAATVELRRSFTTGSSWVVVDKYTANVELIGEEPERNILYDWGVNSGYYTSGTIAGRLSQ